MFLITIAVFAPCLPEAMPLRGAQQILTLPLVTALRVTVGGRAALRNLTLGVGLEPSGRCLSLSSGVLLKVTIQTLLGSPAGEKTVTSELQSQDSDPELSLQTRRVSIPTRPRVCGPTSETSTSRLRAAARKWGGELRGRCPLGCCPGRAPGLPGRRRGVRAGPVLGRGGSSPACRHDRCLPGRPKWTVPNRRGLGTECTPHFPTSPLANKP